MVEGAQFLSWLEQQDWAELPPGTLVTYSGDLLRAHGVYRVHDLYGFCYILTTDDLPYLRLIAKRRDITPVDVP